VIRIWYMEYRQISYTGKQSVFGTPLNLGLIWERIAKGESHEKNFRNKFFAIAL
jgi:hypothetical protein